MKLAVGSRVTIKSKYGSVEELKHSVVYKRILKMNQPYAYIKRIDLDLNFYVIIESHANEIGGDFYNEDDIELDYKYYRKEKLKKIKKINESR